jgi:hypothetical protein
MTLLLPTTLALALLAPGAPEDSAAALGKGEVRVFVVKKDGSPADMTGATVLVYLEPQGGRRQTLKPEAKPGAPAKVGDLPKDAAWRDAEDVRVGVAFSVPPKPLDVAHHAASFTSEGYACVMKDAPPQEKPGKCPECGMEMEKGLVDLDATVVLKLEGKTFSVRGFHFPPEKAPETFAAGVAEIETALEELDRLVAAGRHDTAHRIADRLARLAAATAETADAPQGPSVAAAAKTIAGLAQELDDSHHFGTKPDVATVMTRYREAIGRLQAAARGTE